MSHFFQTAYKELPETVYALLVLIVIDYVTGVCLAVKEKTASSKVGAKGIASKVLIVCLVALSYIVDTWILHSGEKFSSITIFFYCANEIIREPLNNRLYLVSTQCISRHLRLAEVISAQNSHYLSTFLLRFPKKGRLPLCQVVESFRPAIASAYKLAQANIAYSRFSFFLSPRYTVFL